MKCHGNGADHCCYLGKYGPCEHIEENTVPGRRWSCGLFRVLGSWEAVHADARYLKDVKPKLEDIGLGVDCGEWPQALVPLPKGRCCWGDG